MKWLIAFVYRAITTVLQCADFFISALNTKLWILILMISLVYLATFFIFAGVWWGVYLCAPTKGFSVNPNSNPIRPGHQASGGASACALPAKA